MALRLVCWTLSIRSYVPIQSIGEDLKAKIGVRRAHHACQVPDPEFWQC
jgi:hypothetical protein